jgi:excisionase family DNA binding protein
MPIEFSADDSEMEFVTTEQAAARMGISDRRIRALIKARILRAKKFGRDWMIDTTSLEHVAMQARPRGRPPKKKP